MPAVIVETNLSVNFIITWSKYLFYKTTIVKDGDNTAKCIYYTIFYINVSDTEVELWEKI